VSLDLAENDYVYIYIGQIERKWAAHWASTILIGAGFISAHLQKSIYGGVCLKTTASKNRQFMEAVVLRRPPL